MKENKDFVDQLSEVLPMFEKFIKAHGGEILEFKKDIPYDDRNKKYSKCEYTIKFFLISLMLLNK